MRVLQTIAHIRNRPTTWLVMVLFLLAIGFSILATDSIPERDNPAPDARPLALLHQDVSERPTAESSREVYGMLDRAKLDAENDAEQRIDSEPEVQVDPQVAPVVFLQDGLVDELQFAPLPVDATRLQIVEGEVVVGEIEMGSAKTGSNSITGEVIVDYESSTTTESSFSEPVGGANLPEAASLIPVEEFDFGVESNGIRIAALPSLENRVVPVAHNTSVYPSVNVPTPTLSPTPAFKPTPQSHSSSVPSPVPVASADAKTIFEDIDTLRSRSILQRPNLVGLSLNEVIARTIQRSSQVAEFQFDALEFQQVAGQELGAFDPVAFLETRVGEGTEPVANQFQVDQPGQFNVKSQDVSIESGVRRRTQTGGEYSVTQSKRFFDDDSGILTPPDQAIARLSFNFSQELLRDAGRKVVLNRVLVANTLAHGESANSLAKISNHVNQVAAAYWELFSDRAKVLVTREQVRLAQSVVEKIEKRVEFDAEKNLVFQARSTLLERQVELSQAVAQARQSQDFLCRLIGDPELMAPELELVTTESPVLAPMPVNLNSELVLAVQNRPEIQQAIANVQAAKLTHHLSLNQLLPRLTLSLDASLNGLDGDFDFSQAFGNQFGSSPTYEVGMNFEVPLNNRTARFRNREAELAAQRVAAEFQNALDGIQLEVKLAYRRLNYIGTALQNLDRVIQNTYSELGIILDRTLVAPRKTDIPSVQLNLLLDAQARLNNAKLEYIDSMLDQQQALIELRRSTGTLMLSDVLRPDEGPANYDRKSLANSLFAENCAAIGETNAVEREINLQNQNFQGQPRRKRPHSGTIDPRIAYPFLNESGHEQPAAVFNQQFPISQHIVPAQSPDSTLRNPKGTQRIAEPEHDSAAKQLSTQMLEQNTKYFPSRSAVPTPLPAKDQVDSDIEKSPASIANAAYGYPSSGNRQR